LFSPLSDRWGSLATLPGVIVASSSSFWSLDSLYPALSVVAGSDTKLRMGSSLTPVRSAAYALNVGAVRRFCFVHSVLIGPSALGLVCKGLLRCAFAAHTALFCFRLWVPPPTIFPDVFSRQACRLRRSFFVNWVIDGDPLPFLLPKWATGGSQEGCPSDCIAV